MSIIVKICSKCSGIISKDIKPYFHKKDYSDDCIGECTKKRPKLAGKFYGFLNKELIVCDTKEEFIANLLPFATKEKKNDVKTED